MIKIVLLDGYALNRDLDWSALRSSGMSFLRSHTGQRYAENPS